MGDKSLMFNLINRCLIMFRDNYYMYKPSVLFLKNYSGGITYYQLFTKHCSLERGKPGGCTRTDYTYLTVLTMTK